VLQEKSFDTGSVILNYAEGPAAGPSLVLLHGLTGSWRAWQAMLPHLTPNWHVYAFDLRGHGKSGRAANHYQVPDYAQDIVAVLHQLGEPAVLMGHSLGALTALATAAMWPAGVRAVVLLDPPFFIRDSGIDEYPKGKEWFGWVYDTVTTASSQEDLVARCRAKAPTADEEEITAMAQEISGVASGTVLASLQDRILGALDLAGALRQVQCPLLLLRGDWADGAALRDADAAFTLANLPSAVVVQIPNGTHMFFREQQDKTLQHIDAFLSAT
jgi:pimeloyl-ACP methyl ester carboxylesterase